MILVNLKLDLTEKLFAKTVEKKTHIRNFYNPVCEKCKQKININIRGGQLFISISFLVKN
jgi:hypothetical protein